MLVATAKGTAEMLAVAGRPFRKGAAQGSSAGWGTRAPAAVAAEDGSGSTDGSDINIRNRINSDSAVDSDGGHSDADSNADSDDEFDSVSQTPDSHPLSFPPQPRVGIRTSARLSRRGAATV